MKTAFISHSGNDKELVDPVVKRLTPSSYRYDTRTFPEGTPIDDSIHEQLNSSDLFVFFASRNSLPPTKSNRIKQELELAHQLVNQNEHYEVLTICIDDEAPSILPDWMTDHIYTKSRSPEVIANKITARQINPGSPSGIPADLCLGREEDQAEISETISKPRGECPKALYFYGWPGIGRKTLMRSALRQNFPWLSGGFPQFSLDEFDDYETLYRQFLFHKGPLQPKELDSYLHSFRNLDAKEQAEQLASEIRDINNQRAIPLISLPRTALSDDGDLAPWIVSLVKEFDWDSVPNMGFASPRGVAARHSGMYKPEIYFKRIGALSRSSSRNVLAQQLKNFGVDFQSPDLDLMVPYIEGHPESIKLAAQYCKEFGIGDVQRSTGELELLLRRRAADFIQKLSLTELEKNVLSVFCDYRYLSIEDLVGLFTDASALEDALGRLVASGILENNPPIYRLAPYLVDALERSQFVRENTEARDRASDYFAQALEQLEDDERVTVSLLDAGIVAKIRGRKLGAFWSAFVLPAQMIRVAKQSYDRGEYGFAQTICMDALDGCENLSTDGKIELYRLLGMSSARLGREQDVRKSARELIKPCAKYPKDQAAA